MGGGGDGGGGLTAGECTSPAEGRGAIAAAVLAAVTARAGLDETEEEFVSAVGAALAAAEARGDTPAAPWEDEPRMERRARDVLNR